MSNLRSIFLGRQCDWVSMFFFGGNGEVSPLVYLLGIDGRSEIGSTIGISDGSRDGNI